MPGQMASVRRNYDVPATRGREVDLLLFKTPVRAQIISSTGSHLYARIVRNGNRVGPLHPCWKIDYRDGRGDRTGQPTPMDRAWSSLTSREQEVSAPANSPQTPTQGEKT